MKKKNNSSSRIKRINQNKRIKTKSANKQKAISFTKKKLSGLIDVKDSVQPYTKSLMPNQAMPKNIY